MKKRIKNKLLLDIIIILVLILIAGCVILLVYQKKSYEAAHVQYDTIKSEAINIIENGTAAEDRTIDFSFLDDKNHVINSWIYIPETNIDYPVVQGIDNEVYLKYDAYGNASVYGAIFINCENNPDFSDYKTIIYGHSMKDGSMFYQLHNYTSEEFAKNHSELYFYLPDGTLLQYNLLCTLKADAYDENVYLNQNVNSLKYLLEKADHIYGEDNQEDIVLLSTCIRGNSRRVVVFQKQKSN